MKRLMTKASNMAIPAFVACLVVAFVATVLVEIANPAGVCGGEFFASCMTK